VSSESEKFEGSDQELMFIE